MSDPYENLANSIILLAVKDYRDALKKLKKWPRNEAAQIMKAEVERFFRSAWYRELTSVDGEFLISKLQAEVHHDGRWKNSESKGIFTSKLSP